MQSEYHDLKTDNTRLRRAFLLSTAFVLALWTIKLIELGFGLDFVPYGIYPLRLSALTGIITAPLIHGSISHLFSNTAPLLILGTALLYGYPRAARIVIPVLYLGAGLGVWLFARSAYHIGASGLSFGMLFFIFTIGILRWDTRAIVLAMVVFFLYGSMIWGIFPGRPGVSFESHFFGAAIGVTLAILLRHLDPMPATKKYSWEEEGEGEGEVVLEENGDKEEPHR